jgi:hypothetical protein
MAAFALSGRAANRQSRTARATRQSWSRLLHRYLTSARGLTKPHLSAVTLAETRARTMTSASASSPLKGLAPASPNPPIHRPSSPYPDPRQLGPRSQILATRTSNYHSTSLRNSQSSSTPRGSLLTICSGDRRPQRQPHKFVPPLPTPSMTRLLTGNRFAPWWRGASAGTYRAGE